VTCDFVRRVSRARERCLTPNAFEGPLTFLGASAASAQSSGAMDPSPPLPASAEAGGAPAEAQQDWWCHDCVQHFRLPSSLPSDSEDLSCARCGGSFVEMVEGPTHIELASNANAEDVFSAARQIARRLAGADVVGTNAQPSNGESEIAAAAREAWTALLGGGGPSNPFEPFSMSHRVIHNPQAHVTGIPALRHGGAFSFGFDGANGAAFFGANALDGFGDVNVAELDTRTFHRPADPEVVARLPRSIRARAGAETTTTGADASRGTTDSADANDPTDASGSCPVCLSDVEVGSVVRTMPCGHEYHETCLLEWLRTKNSCPVCRVTLPTIEGSSRA